MWADYASNGGVMTDQTAPELPTWIQTMLPEGVKRYCLEIENETMHVMEVGSVVSLITDSNLKHAFCYPDPRFNVLGA